MYANKDKTTILRNALQKLQNKTPITAIGPGSVARALAESVVNELGDFYAAMDYNTSMTLISTASGRALDLIGELYGVQRKTLGEVAAVDQSIGAFYFYLDAPHTADITIPSGTKVFTDAENFIGEQYVYSTTRDVVLLAGRVRAYAGLRPLFTDSVFTAGKHTITKHNFSVEGVDLKATNPKAIAPQRGYETDENLRTRIIKSVRTSAGGTKEAVRFAGLGVEGVRDVRVRTAPYGLGSMEALVVSEEQSTAQWVTAAVIDELEKVKPAGVRLIVREPDYAACGVHATIVLKNGIRIDPDTAARRAEIAMIRHLNTYLPGDHLVFTQLIQSVLDASNAILDVQLDRLNINGIEIPRSNYRTDEDKQIVPGQIVVTTV